MSSAVILQSFVMVGMSPSPVLPLCNCVIEVGMSALPAMVAMNPIWTAGPVPAAQG